MHLIKMLHEFTAGEPARILLYLAMTASAVFAALSSGEKNSLKFKPWLPLFSCLAAAILLDAGLMKGWALSLSIIMVFAAFCCFAFEAAKTSGATGEFPGGKAMIFITLSAAVFILSALLKTAWVCDDAYITARTADNFLNGYGLRWNTDERVQAYTHPLWLFVFTAAYYFVRDPFMVYMAMGLGFTAASVILLKSVVNSRLRFAFVLVLLALSKTFIDWSTSGLENPMLCFLAAVFFYRYMKPGSSSRKIFTLSLTASAAMLTRLDSALLFIFPLAYSLWENKKTSGALACAAGFLPLLCWEAFSMFYYGFPLPNTFYAKMAGGFSIFKYMGSGLYYFFDSTRFDFLTTAVMAAGIGLPFYSRRNDPEGKKMMMPAAGVLLYLLYFIRIGGDFMQGRFFAVPFFICVMVLARQKELYWAKTFIPALLLCFMLAMAPPSYSFLLDSLEGNENKSVPAREFYAPGSGLKKMIEEGNTGMAYNTFVATALKWKHDAASSRQVYSIHSLGFPGYFAGPKVHIVDRLGLSDAFLSHLKGKFFEKAGHIYRDLPEGYMESIKTGKNMIKDRNLAEYYDKISLITSGRLTDPERFRAILKMNTGQYDYLLKGK